MHSISSGCFNSCKVRGFSREPSLRGRGETNILKPERKPDHHLERCFGSSKFQLEKVSKLLIVYKTWSYK
jgi:hypothetical protein